MTNPEQLAVDILKRTDPFYKKLETLSFRFDQELTQPDPVISIDGATISSRRYITAITGHSKAGKTGAVTAIIAGTLAKPGDIVETLGLQIKPNRDGLLTLHIDTEQSQYNHHKAIRNAFNRAHRSAAPDWFKSYLLRELSVKEKKQAIQLLLQTHNAEFGGVHIVLIDGVGDLVQSVNDEQECNELVLFLEQLAIRYNCPVVTILHLNPGSSVKSRGHLGSQMERKCESMLTILKDPDTEISVLEGKLLRNAGGIPAIQFKYDADKGYHVMCGVVNREAERALKLEMDEKEKFKNYNYYAQLFFSTGELKSADVIDKIKIAYNVKDRAAYKKMEEMKDLGIIEYTENQTYRYVGDEEIPF